MIDRKLVVIINGRGGSGKDTVCDIVGKHYATKNVSSITIIKRAAAILGWKGGKEANDRKFLSDLKKLSNEYNGMPFSEMAREYKLFRTFWTEIMFVHIREPEEIASFYTYVKMDGRADVTTLLVKSERTEESFGNESDDNVDMYPYDHVFHNDCPLEELEDKFMTFFDNEILKKPE